MDSASTYIELCSALFRGDQNSLQTVLDNGAPMDIMPGFYPIHYAVKGGNVKCLEMLLNQPGIHINRMVKDSGDTPLHLAVRFQQNVKEICELLVSHGADVSILNDAEETAFELALGLKDAPADLYGVLLNEKALSPEYDLHLEAVAARNVEAVKAVLSFEKKFPSVKPNVSGCRGLIVCAAEEGNLEILGLLFGHYRAEAIGNDLGDSMLANCVRESPQIAILALIDLGCSSVVFDVVHGRWEISAINCIIEYADQEAFDLILKGIDSKRVKAFNSVAQCPVHQLRHLNHVTDKNPLVTAVEEQKWDCLLKLLLVGFDPSVPMTQKAWRFRSFDSARRYAHLFSTYSVAWLLRNIFSSRDGIHNLLCAAILEINVTCLVNALYSQNEIDLLSEIREKVIQSLLAHGANVNSTVCVEMTPLVALVASCSNSNDTERYFGLFMNAGAYLDYWSNCSPFQSPDLAIAAAITGQEAVLAQLLALLPGSAVMDLLIDLSNFNLNAEQTMGDEEDGMNFCLRWNLWMLRRNVGRSVQVLLSFTATKSSELREAVRSINEHFVVSENEEDPQLTADQLANIVECQQIWERILESLERVTSLRHMCRLVIANSVKLRCSVLGRGLVQSVDQLQLPRPLKNVIMFQDKFPLLCDVENIKLRTYENAAEVH